MDNIDHIIRPCIGAPWKLHGRDLQGFDCYGLVWYILTQTDKKVPDYGYECETAGKRILPGLVDAKAHRVKGPAPGRLALIGDMHIAIMVDHSRAIQCNKKRGVHLVRVALLKEPIQYYEVL